MARVEGSIEIDLPASTAAQQWSRYESADRCVTWRSLRGVRRHGSLSFAPVGAGRTRVTLRLDYRSSGLVEFVTDRLGLVSARIAADLRRFTAFVESRERALARLEQRRRDLDRLRESIGARAPSG